MTRNTITLKPGELACDFASPNVSHTFLKQQGYKACIRYIDGGTTSWKVLSTGELTRLIAAGFGVALVWETYEGRPLEGAAAGTQDGLRANADARRLGYPTTEAIIIACDTDINASNVTKAVEYCMAFKAACAHPVGCYGDWDLLDALWRRGFDGVMNVQPNARGWSFDWVRMLWRGVHPTAHMLQKPSKTDVDPDLVYKPVQFWAGPTPVTPPPPHPPTENTKDDLMTPISANVYDSRKGVALKPGEPRFVAITQPATAVQVALTVVGPTAKGDLRIGQNPTTAPLHYEAGQTITNTTIAAIETAPDGRKGITVTSLAATHLLVDLQAVWG